VWGAPCLPLLLKNSLGLTFSDQGQNELAESCFAEFYATTREMGDLTT